MEQKPFKDPKDLLHHPPTPTPPTRRLKEQLTRFITATSFRVSRTFSVSLLCPGWNNRQLRSPFTTKLVRDLSASFRTRSRTPQASVRQRPLADRRGPEAPSVSRSDHLFKATLISLRFCAFSSCGLTEQVVVNYMYRSVIDQRHNVSVCVCVCVFTVSAAGCVYPSKWRNSVLRP